MPQALTWIAGWPGIALGLLFMLMGVRLRREERRQRRRLLPGQPFSGREVLWEGVAFALIGTGNLLGGRWVLLTLPAVAVMTLLFVRLIARWARSPSRRSD
ncbi:hypothetical protein [Micromonospora sp. 4G55]|uniref:hypothetical protein n=1 Tax=Micromonospora sp. 4G55 TaxID=2806102 RepID=UPI001A402E8B|nr:hypothetical protein [Micromonospora sp. 4G55]MBM0259829.1 hypothetical protein [Micromonospora sp. 4G55]